YIPDGCNYRVRKVTIATGIITTVAGTGVQGFSGDGGPGTAAMIGFPLAVAVDASDNLYIADQDDRRVRKVATDGVITTVAGGGTQDDNVPATSAQLGILRGLAVDAGSNLFLAEAYGGYYGNDNLRIRKVSAASGIIGTFGSPLNYWGGVDDGL